MGWRVAVDIGGTFTDLSSFDDESGEMRFAKVASTPAAFEQGVVEAIAATGVAPEAFAFFVHGTTAVINAITERRGAKTGLLTTRGMADVLEIARGNRPDIYNLRYRKPEPFVPRHLRLAVSERLNAEGQVVQELSEDDVVAAVKTFREERVESIAVCFLHAYANPEHEKKAGEVLRRAMPEVFVSLSHELSGEFREYERTSTAVLNSYVGPVCSRYLGNLARKVEDIGVGVKPYVMSSNGGVWPMARAQRIPINLVESGPAAGVSGAAGIGARLGIDNLISFDVGGTTAKCSLIERHTVNVVTEYHVERTRTSAGYPVRVPVIDILEIGAGGGSIAWRDSEGAIRVGPRSAGADPGPAAYGRAGGNLPTVTDANLIAGRIDPAYFLGGQMPLHINRARDAFAGLAGELGESIDQTAHGILRIASGSMINSVKIISVQRGHDPRDFALVAMGGAGPLHAGHIARELHISKVIVPVAPAHFSATGMLNSDLRRDYVRTHVLRTDRQMTGQIEALFGELEIQAEREHSQEGSPGQLRLSRETDMRYRGQEHTVHVQCGPGPLDDQGVHVLEDKFHENHEKRYSFRLDSPIEIVNFHLVAWGIMPKPVWKPLNSIETIARPIGTRAVWFEDEGRRTVPVYRRNELASGTTIRGPAVVEEVATVTLVYPDAELAVHELGELIIESPA